MALLPEPFGIMPAQFFGFFRGEILLFMGMEVFFHLPYDMLGIMVIRNLQICRHPGNLVGVAAGRAKFPFLVPVHVRKRFAPRTPEDVVHKHEVISASSIKIY